MQMLLATAVLVLACPVLAQETPETPKDSVQLLVTGCLDGRMLEAEEVDATGESIEVPVRSFRLSGKKPLMADVRARDGQRVEITGFVRKIDLQEPGFKVKGGRIVLGAPGASDPSRRQAPMPSRRIIGLEVIAIEPAAGSCS